MFHFATCSVLLKYMSWWC